MLQHEGMKGWVVSKLGPGIYHHMSHPDSAVAIRNRGWLHGHVPRRTTAGNSLSRTSPMRQNIRCMRAMSTVHAPHAPPKK